MLHMEGLHFSEEKENGMDGGSWVEGLGGKEGGTGNCDWAGEKLIN